MKNYLTDIEGIKVGHANSEEGGTGVTVIICEKGAVGGIDVRGSAPGTRETALFDPKKMVDKIHAVVLSGGSAFGLDASGGVMKFLEERGVGFKTPFGIVPIVSQAVIYDLNSGNPKIRPDFNMGYEAAKNANYDENRRGVVGAGYGATVSKTLGFDKAIKSGIGSCTIEHKGLKVSALVVLNALGDIYDGEKIISFPYDRKTKEKFSSLEVFKNQNAGFSNTNTTIGIIITNAKLNKSMANKVSEISHNAYARCIRPVHTMSDGDTIFTMATGEIEANIDKILVMAVDSMEKAIIDAINSAKTINGYLAITDIE